MLSETDDRNDQGKAGELGITLIASILARPISRVPRRKLQGRAARPQAGAGASAGTRATPAGRTGSSRATHPLTPATIPSHTSGATEVSDDLDRA